MHICLRAARLTLFGAQMFFVFVSAIAVATAEVVRTVLPPAYVYNPANNPNAFRYDFVNLPKNQYYMSARYQRPNWSDPASTPIRYTTGFNVQPNTGLGPLTSTYQRGPLGGNAAQSVFQLKGYAGGSLMRSWDSPHPISGAQYPTCWPNCAGAEKHTVYEYEWSTPPYAFQQTSNPYDPDDGLVLQADMQVPQYEQWSTITGGAPLDTTLGQYAFLLFLEDPNGKTVQFVIYVYYSDAGIYDGSEGASLELVGSELRPYITTSVKRNRVMTFSTIKTDNSGDFSNTTWTGLRFFRVYITPQNLQNVVATMNGNPYYVGLSTDVLHYKVKKVGINQEISYQDNGDAVVFGASFNAFGIYEIKP